MIYSNDIAVQTAKYLLQIKAIKLQPAKPFTWASGWKSPIYCDNRKILSYPKIRTYVRQQLAAIISAVYGNPEVIAGVATGGIAIGALVAEELGLPYIYVRPEKKEHGLQKKVEGDLVSGQRVVVIEDLVSTGGSSLSAVKTLKKEKCSIVGMVAVFTYGFASTYHNFRKNNCPLTLLCDYDTLVEEALSAKYINESEYLILQGWSKKPEEWK